MEHQESRRYLGELIARQQTYTTEARSVTKQPLRESKAIELITRFSVRYGHKFNSLIESDDTYNMMLADFQTELHGLSDEQIEHGYSQLPKGWHPEVKEFRALCTGDDGLHKSRAYRNFDPSKAIGHKCDPLKAREQILKSRQILAGMTA